MAKLFKFLMFVLVIAGVVVAGYFWWQGREPDDQGFKQVEVTRGSITEKAIAVGQIEPRLKFEVKSKIPGIVSHCFVEVGDQVRPGDPLFEIAPDPTPTELVEAERRVETAESAYRRAEAEWNRIAQLVDQGIVSQDQRDIKREAFELAEIELAGARDNFDLVKEGRISSRGRSVESIVRAPAGGIVLARLVDPGDPVVPLTSFQPGTQLATIADMSDLIFEGTVDEIDVGKLSVDVPARLNIGALPGAVVSGRLSRIAPQAREEEGARLFDVEIELDELIDAETVLRAGYSSTADLVIREKTDILLIPERLVLFENDGADTFVELPPEVEGGEPVKVAVELGLSGGLSIEVISGLEEGMQIIERPPREIL
jgi:HlyD family secretion protein